MFREHQSAVGVWARACPDNMARVIQFVILTIRQPLHKAAVDIQALIDGSPDADRAVWGFKGRACAEAWRDRYEIYAFLEMTWFTEESEKETACAMIEYLASMHGLGPVKAGFVTQLAYGIGGCIDTHNLVRFKLPMRTFSNFSQRKTPQARRKMVNRYVKTCYRLGGPEKLWDSWCEYVAANQPKTYQSAEHVSRIHAEAFGL